MNYEIIVLMKRNKAAFAFNRLFCKKHNGICKVKIVKCSHFKCVNPLFENIIKRGQLRNMYFATLYI